MSQKSILSFFKKTPPKAAASNGHAINSPPDADDSASNKRLSSDARANISNSSDTDLNESLVRQKRTNKKRQRIVSSSDESNAENNSPPKNDKKKNRLSTPDCVVPKIESKSPASKKSPPLETKSRTSETNIDDTDKRRKTPKSKKNVQSDEMETSPVVAKKPKATPKSKASPADKKSSKKAKAEPVSPDDKKPGKNTESNSDENSSKKPSSIAALFAKNSSASPATAKTAKKLKIESDSEDDDTKKVQAPPKHETKEDKKATMASFFIRTSQKPDSSDGPKPKTSELDYNPTKANYDPVEDAFWKKGDKVPYLALTKTFSVIEETSGRLKMIEYLANFLRSVIALSPDDLTACVYLCLNQLAPAYEGIELGVAETALMKVIAQTTGRSMAQVKQDAKETGDLGIVAEHSKSNQRMMIVPAPLTVRGVFAKLKDIATKPTGSSAMNQKTDKIQSIFVACRHSEARYFIRSLLGKLRTGLAEQSVLQALAQAVALTERPDMVADGDADGRTPSKSSKRRKKLTGDALKAYIDASALTLKTTFCQCPNYDQIVAVVLADGIDGLLERCPMRPGTPLKPMLAHPTRGIQEVLDRFDGIRFTAEWKYDGERTQIHIDDAGTVSIYSRNQENNTGKYPDIIGRVQNAFKLGKAGMRSCILDCEAVAWDAERQQILPFQVLSTRKRKVAVEDEIKVRVCAFMFDLLYWDGQPLVTRPFQERRDLLHEHFVEVPGEWRMATSLDTGDMDELQTFLEDSIKGNCEGLMVKTLDKDATYEIAKRSRNWLKIKKDYLSGVGDSLDLVVIGGYHGKGKRTGTFGGFLLACYDADAEQYQSICKIGTGFSDDDLQKHTEFLSGHRLPKAKSYYAYDAGHEADVWFDAVQVWEVLCADLSLSPVHQAAKGLVDPEKGISLRFPRFIRIRDDKSAEDATSAQQVADMYSNQDQIKNQAKPSAKDCEEDFY